MIEISVILPTYNRRAQLARLLNSLLDSSFDMEKVEIIIIDDCSRDDTVDFLKKNFLEKYSNIFLIEKEKNTRKADCVNRGYRRSRGKYLFFIDDDTVLAKDALEQLYLFCKKNGDKSFVAPLMYSYSGKKDKIWFAGLKMNFWTTTGTFVAQGKKEPLFEGDALETDAILTAFMVHRKIFDEIGAFNTELFPFQFEELDFCVRSRFAGYNLSVLPSAKLWHDHEDGVFLNNPWRLFLEVRNRIISAKLWSANPLQVLVSRLFAVAIPLAYIPIKTFLYREQYFQCLASIGSGLLEGIKISTKVTPYYKREKKDLHRNVF